MRLRALCSSFCRLQSDPACLQVKCGLGIGSLAGGMVQENATLIRTYSELQAKWDTIKLLSQIHLAIASSSRLAFATPKLMSAASNRSTSNRTASSISRRADSRRRLPRSTRKRVTDRDQPRSRCHQGSFPTKP